MQKLIIIFSVTFIIVLVLITSTSGSVLPVFSRLFEGYFAILTVFGATSIAFSNYLDTVIRDIPEKKRKENPEAYSSVVDSFIDLKNELISNVLLFVGLIIVNYILMGIVDLSINACAWGIKMNWIIGSAQLSLFIVATYTVYSQISSFKTANEYKRIILKGESL